MSDITLQEFVWEPIEKGHLISKVQHDSVLAYRIERLEERIKKLETNS